MDSRSEEQRDQGGAADETTSLFELQKKRQEEEDLIAIYKERKQVLKSLERKIDKLNRDFKNAQKLHSSFEKYEDAYEAVEKAESEMQQVFQIEEELQRIEKEYSQLQKKKQKLKVQVQRHCVYKHYMERVLKMTTFEDVESLSGQLENLFHFRDKLYKNGNEAQEKANQKRESLGTLRNQHYWMQLQKDTKLSQLNSELEETRSQTLKLERRWNHIHEIAATKTLLLGQIKIATLNLYEMAGGDFEEDQFVKINDTKKQLDRVMIFIEDQEDIIKRHQTLLAKQAKGKRKVQKYN